MNFVLLASFCAWVGWLTCIFRCFIGLFGILEWLCYGILSCELVLFRVLYCGWDLIPVVICFGGLVFLVRGVVLAVIGFR